MKSIDDITKQTLNTQQQRQDVAANDDFLPVKINYQEKQDIAVVIWKNMAAKYGRQWVNDMGASCKEDGKLTFVAKSWIKELIDLTPEDIRNGFEKLGQYHKVFYPNVFQFKALCNKCEYQPTTEEIVRILFSGTGCDKTISSRNKYPIVLAIRNNVDMFSLRTMSTTQATSIINKLREEFIAKGVPVWPEHAHVEILGVSDQSKKTNISSKSVALAAILNIKRNIGATV